MKKLLKSLMLFAAAAMALTSCENEAMNEGIEANDTYTMTFVADAPQSRTSVSIEGEQANFAWTAGDKVGFYYTGTSVDYKKKGNATATIAANGTATFTASFESKEGETSYNIAAFYPSESWGTHATTNYFNNVNVKVPASQALTEGSFDPAADLMMSKPFMGVALNSNTTKVLEFARLVAVGKMNLKLEGMVDGEVIKEVKLTFANHTLNGDVVLDMENGTYKLGTTTSKTVTLSGELAANADRTAIFFTCLPGEFSGAYTINVTTDKATYEKEATITKALSFTAGDVLGFNATVGNREEFKVEAGVVVDVLNREFTGISKNSTSYAAWTGKTGDSGAVYAGNSAGDKDAIQLRSNNSNSGIVTTTSGGQVSKVVVTWVGDTADGRTLDIYGKTSAYAAASDLYATSTQGTKLGSIKKGTSTELEISGDYTFIGMRSNSGAMYISEIKIYWAGGDTRTSQELEFSTDVVNYTFGSAEAFEKPTLTGAQTGVVYTSSNEDVAEVDENTGAVTIVGTGSAVITAIAEENDTYKEGKASYTINVSSADLAGTGAGTEEDPYDVTRLQAKIKNGEIPSGNIYVKGVVSEVKSISVSYGNAEYYISADGTKTNQFQVYRGMYLDGAKFTSEDQLIVSDEVVVCGTLTTYNNVYQFAQGTSIVSLKRTKLVMSTITCTNDGVNENSLTFSWTAVANATSYEVSLNGVSKGSVTGTTYTATGLESGTEYLFGVKAVATGYTTSDEKTCLAKTKAGAGDVVVETATATLSFASTAQRTEYSTSKQVWVQNGITLTNDKSSSTSSVGNYSNPARFYKSSKITVVGPGNMTKIVFDCNNTTYANDLKSSIGTVSGATVSVSSDKVTVSFTSSVESFVIAALTAQVRMDSLTVTYEK